MNNLIVVVFMWLLVLTLALRARTRPDNTMLKAAIVIAASLTTNIDGLYLWAANRLPWPNGLDLAANVLLIFGVYYLSLAIAHGARAGDSTTGMQAMWLRRAAVITVVIMTVSFAFIDDPVPSFSFMLDYGSQPSAALYSGIQYLYILAVMVGTLVTCLRNVPQMRRRRFRVGFRIIALGCIAGIVLCLSVLVMDAGNVTGNEELRRAAATVYDVSNPLTVVLLSAGLAVAPIGRILSDLGARRQIRVLEPRLREVWLATVAQTPAVSLVGTTAQSVTGAQRNRRRNTADTIHRLVIEIHDWMDLAENSGREMSPADRSVLNRAEALCLKHDRHL
ncbi:hypothetical protein QMA10_08205 [Arthrobacter sp. APC 3897]|uniref:hypothetical protein n=1 Tax=Arthrobacter sp. APC 3897 TaxID=3035204 RepID=UPI0025B31EA4|nr:hypothetical protein [Arthrobacter sp. APC 3897]MDN3481905.1 hypothetical protein [Arthrobacter sp. APC 3897]